jgi:hypothetical protein
VFKVFNYQPYSPQPYPSTTNIKTLHDHAMGAEFITSVPYLNIGTDNVLRFLKLMSANRVD